MIALHALAASSQFQESAQIGGAFAAPRSRRRQHRTAAHRPRLDARRRARPRSATPTAAAPVARRQRCPRPRRAAPRASWRARRSSATDSRHHRRLSSRRRSRLHSPRCSSPPHCHCRRRFHQSIHRCSASRSPCGGRRACSAALRRNGKRRYLAWWRRCRARPATARQHTRLWRAGASGGRATAPPTPRLRACRRSSRPPRRCVRGRCRGHRRCRCRCRCPQRCR